MNTPPDKYLRWRICPLAVLACCALATNAAALDPAGGLQHAVDELAGASTARQLRFIDAAVDELSAAYRQLSADADGGQTRWVGSTRAFNGRLRAAAAAAHRGDAIRILTEADGTVRVVVGSQPARQFMITAPTAGGGAVLERAILQRFCRDDGCGRPPPRMRAAASATTRAIQLALAARPPASMTSIASTSGSETDADNQSPRLLPSVLAPAFPAGDDGLRCRVNGARHARLYASACRELEREIRALAAAVHAAANRGVAIAWPTIALPALRTASNLLPLNERGDTVALALPALSRAPELRALLVPWLQDQLIGRVRELVFEPPSRLIYAVR